MIKLNAATTSPHSTGHCTAEIDRGTAHDRYADTLTVIEACAASHRSGRDTTRH